ncbi:hypothetical protein MCOR02_006400 [Pyricularia oryzae]|uniref:J domain-containing protein n=1 Tax=Pyricularia oryzae TaxID=318829 RepID=A0A4P7NJE7_PYROR|nr:hypothetical protein MCOR02_006400 [Pyricularia oryzae]KAI6324441.1 hypothetical protein MCOR34_001525 [Pyricularia oryzae]KAI6439159.1 hypothetical protein MCOR17_011925 [Pyricularia oryzae]KAI6499762.1 hypothetical protein MCOR13_006193 [Pyricularia oryzae]KAI6575714.1 hypothetical protein MCOR04_006965 [Pyricularia oryzae]
MDSYQEPTGEEPPTIDPYEVLSLDHTATPDQVKAAYRKAALKNHPDKVPEDQKASAHEKFQQIAFAYAVLSDPARRARYDATGSTSESIVDSDGFDWSDFYRAQFADAVSGEAIEKFARTYKGSDEERDDVLAAYEAGRGDLDVVYESVMLSNVLEDDERFRAWIDEAISKGDVEGFKAYTKESKKKRDKRVKDAKGEAAEAEEYAKELGVHGKLFGGGAAGEGKGKGKGKKKDAGGEDALAALIRGRQADRMDALDRLAEKYGAAAPKAKKKGKKRAAEDEDDEDGSEPSEEAFQATQARLFGKKSNGEKAAAGSTKKRTRRG